MATNDTKITIPCTEQSQERDLDSDISRRAQWLRAAILGANDGLVSTSSLMMGVGAVKSDPKAMVLSGFAGLIAGACSMAIGEFVSVSSQLDAELAQLKRDQRTDKADRAGLPSPIQAAVASALAFAMGAIVPLLAAGFIANYKIRIAAVAVAATMALLIFGCLGAVLGRAPVARAAARVIIGGWAAMGLTFGLMKLFGSAGL
ncbi:vacuolar iron transporter 4-like protein [Carex littledalei]|uniref:Vacuolar iron transporter n=1 Tax=Carex littledalei TaxID=544730 RepID=A0A833QVF1_9POAL|nr:vacuolar iron transporter 4-like protein [Carex littledalei]